MVRFVTFGDTINNTLFTINCDKIVLLIYINQFDYKKLVIILEDTNNIKALPNNEITLQGLLAQEVYDEILKYMNG